jgi:hypothetical protein
MIHCCPAACDVELDGRGPEHAMPEEWVQLALPWERSGPSLAGGFPPFGFGREGGVLDARNPVLGVE